MSVLITTCRAMTYFFQNKSRGEGVAPRNDDFEDENDDAKVDAEDEEEPEVDQFLMPPPEAQQLDEAEAEADSLQQEESEVVPPAASSVSLPPSSPEEDQWSDRLVQGLTELVKEGSAKVKEHAVTALFNITQLSDTVLKKVSPECFAVGTSPWAVAVLTSFLFGRWYSICRGWWRCASASSRSSITRPA